MSFTNEYKIDGDITTIYIRRKNGEVVETLIDTEDLELLRKLDYRWFVQYDTHLDSYYVRSNKYIGFENGKSKYTPKLLHIEVMRSNPQNGEYVDHINHNTLDNRKSNLRITAQYKNTKNREKKNSNNKSGYRNVSWIKSKGKWCVQLIVNGKNTILGKFDDVHEAGKFAEKMREKYYGEFKGAS